MHNTRRRPLQRPPHLEKRDGDLNGLTQEVSIKKEAVATVKKLILEFNLTKGDIRGKAMKQSEG